MFSVNSVWGKALSLLKTRMNVAAYNNWIGTLKPIGTGANGELLLMAPDELHRNMLRNGYKSMVENAVRETGGPWSSVRFVIQNETDAAPVSADMGSGYAFVCYSERDADDGREIIAGLNQNGIRTWAHQNDIAGGTKRPGEVQEAVRACSWFVLVLTEAAQSSSWIRMLTELAYGKPIIAVTVSDMTPNESTTRLLRHAELFDLNSYFPHSEAMTCLAKTLRSAKPGNAAAPAARPSVGSVQQPSGSGYAAATDPAKGLLKPRAYFGNDPYIFISYSHRDEERAYRFISALQKGYNVWYDEGILYGREWEDEIAAKLKGCSLFLYLVTSASLESPNCRDELYHARELSKPFINIVTEKFTCQFPDWFTLRYGRYQRFPLHSFSSDDEAIEDLVRKNDELYKVKK